MLKQTCYGINVGCSLSVPDGSCVSLLFLLVISRISFSHYQRTVLPIYGHLLSVTLFFFFNLQFDMFFHNKRSSCFGSVLDGCNC